MGGGRNDPEADRWTAALLWEACRRHPDATVVRTAIANGADLTTASDVAVDQRVGALLWRALEAADVPEIGGEGRARLRAVADACRMEAQLLLPAAVSMALEPLTAAGLEPVILKGPVVAARYPRPGLRPMEDIDLLLPPEHHGRALVRLCAAGWEVARPARRDTYDTALTHPEVPSLSLELHFGLEPSYYRVTSLDATALWRLRRPIECLGTAAFGLPLPEELVLLAAHAAKPLHDFCRLVWIADLAMIVGYHVEGGTGVDWEHVQAVADAGRCRTRVAVALELARRAGVDSPSNLFPLPETMWRVDAVSRLLDARRPLARSGLACSHLQYALTDDRWKRMRILAVLVASGYGIGGRVRDAVAAVTRVMARTSKADGCPRVVHREALARRPGTRAW